MAALDFGWISKADFSPHRWRGPAMISDFEFVDMWRVPVEGGPEDTLEDLLQTLRNAVDKQKRSSVEKMLWQVRGILGKCLKEKENEASCVGLFPIPGCKEWSLVERLPNDLKDTAQTTHWLLGHPPVYRLRNEAMWEESSAPCHIACMWVMSPQSGGGWVLEMPIYVKPNGFFGRLYMKVVKPFRVFIYHLARYSEGMG